MADVKIDIPGVGEVVAEGAASEQTLKQIVKLLGGGNSLAKGDKKGPLGKESEETAKSIDDLGKQSDETTGALGSLAKGATGLIGGAFNALTAAIGSVVGAIPGFAGELLFGGNRISDFAQHIPLVGESLSGLTKAVEGQMDVFRELSTIGAGFGNNMFELASVAGRSAIPQEEFANLLQSNAEGIRIFGNSIQDGARNFGRLSKELRQSTAGQDLMAMGFTTQELNENLISYSQLTQLSGRRANMTQEQLIQGSLEYSRELDKIAKLTGKSRKDIEAQQKAASLDIRRQMAIAEAGDNLRDRLSQVAAVSPEIEAALVDMADGVANDPLTQQLMANNATFAAQAKNVKNMTAEQANNFLRSMADDGMKFANTLGKAGVQASISGGTATGEYLKSIGQLQKIQKTTAGITKEEQEKRNKVTKAFATAEEALNNVKGKIISNIVDSDVFKKVTDTIGDLIPTVEEMDGYYETASKYFQSDILPKLKELQTAFKKVDWGKYLKKITGWFESLSGKAGELGTGAIDKIKNMIKGITGWWEDGGKQKFEESMNQLSLFYDNHVKPIIDKILGGDFSGAFDDIGNLLKGLATSALKSMFADFDWVSFGVSAAGLLVLTLAKLNPFGLVASTLISGIVGFIGWDNIKSFFSNLSLGEAIGNMWQKIKDGFAGLFNFDFEFPNFKSYLPKWLGGEGKSLSSLFSGDGGAEQQTASNNTPPKVDSSDPSEETAKEFMDKQNQKAGAQTQVATNNAEAGANAINIQLAELIDINKKANKLISALNGNVMAG